MQINRLPQLKDAEYMGDAVYVKMDAGYLRIMTSDGLDVNNTIFMEPEVFENVLAFYNKQKLTNQTEEIL